MNNFEYINNQLYSIYTIDYPYIINSMGQYISEIITEKDYIKYFENDQKWKSYQMYLDQIE